MEIRIDFPLMEEAVRREAERREREGDPTLFEHYHGLADSLYELSLEEQEEGFERLHQDLFQKLGLAKILEEAFEEFPQLQKRIDQVEVRRARSESEEGADLLKSSLLPEGARILKVGLMGSRFSDIPWLRKLLRHELMHVADMLEEAFGYRDEPLGANPSEEAFRVSCYRTLWDIYIDSRLMRQGRETVADQEERRGELEQVYRKIPPAKRARIFEALWSLERMTHPEMVELSKDPRQLLAMIGEEGLPEETIQAGRLLLPGSPCPLCSFPTYQWMEISEREVIEAIQADYPQWDAEQGVCERCLDLYQFQVELIN